MAKDEMKIDEFLDKQQTSTIAMTAEVVVDDDKMVKLTPWISGSGCLCHAAITIPKADIDRVKPTGEVHHCCGKRLGVVEVHFKKDASIGLGALMSQLASTTGSAPAGGSHDMLHSQWSGQPGVVLGGWFQGWLCNQHYNNCWVNCARTSSGEQFENCMCRCRNDYFMCLGNVGPLQDCDLMFETNSSSSGRRGRR